MTTSERIRVLVADRSPSNRETLITILSASPEFLVAGTAAGGREVIDRCRELRPDVISLGLEEIESIEHIMAHFPTPILILASPSQQGLARSSTPALAAGAVEVLEVGSSDWTDGEWRDRYLHTLKLVSNVRVITHPRGRLARLPSLSKKGQQTLGPAPATATAKSPIQVIAIGGSTGGPGAVAQILRGIPRGFELPLLLVLHTSEPFGEGLAGWLNSLSPVPVRYAKDAELLSKAKGVLMAPPGKHLVFGKGRLYLTSDPLRHSCRPSVDVLFESLVPIAEQTCACLLTGMGKDGALGLLALRQAGAATIAQDEASSIVYGMPREAALLGAASHVTSLGLISKRILDFSFGKRAPRAP